MNVAPETRAADGNANTSHTSSPTRAAVKVQA